MRAPCEGGREERPWERGWTRVVRFRTKEITEFCPSGLTQSSSMAHARNDCSQSSRFLPQARRIVGSRDENALRFDATDVHAQCHNLGGNLLPAAVSAPAVAVCLNSLIFETVRLIGNSNTVEQGNLRKSATSYDSASRAHFE